METLIKRSAFLVDVRTEVNLLKVTNGSTNIPLDQVANQLENLKEKSKLLFFGQRKSQWSGQNDFGTKWFQNVINGGTWQDVTEAIAK
jgi:rhodanese-related sulfurtransferase